MADFESKLISSSDSDLLTYLSSPPDFFLGYSPRCVFLLLQQIVSSQSEVEIFNNFQKKTNSRS